MPEQLPSSVLIVDDNEDLRNLLASILTLSGYHALQAGNGREALAVIEEGVKPHVILLDLNMPVMNGYTFLEHRAVHPALSCIPVFVITGAFDSTDVHRYGVMHVFCKPLAVPQLLAALSALLDSPKAPDN